MEKHLTSLLSNEDIDNFRSQAKQIKDTSSVLRWDEFAKEPCPEITDTHKIIHNTSLGKIMLDLEVPPHVKDMMVKIANDNGLNVRFIRGGYVEYAHEYGKPELVNHMDEIDLFMVDYQLSSSTIWPITVNGTTYELKDNDALAFCPKRMTHGRPVKEFIPGEHIGMIFFDMEILGNLNNTDKA